MAKHPEMESLKDSLLKRLYFETSQSCAELSEGLSRSIPLVTKSLNELIEAGLVETNGYAPSTGGRRAARYLLRPDTGYIMAVAMDQLFTKMVIVDLANHEVTPEKTIELDLHTQDNALSLLAEAVNQYLSEVSIPRNEIIGVGIGMPGFINIQDGTNYTFLEKTKGSHRQLLADKIGLPVYIDNDSSLTALAEWTFGLAKGQRNAMIINVGWGTGLGMIVNGELFRGDAGYAGEFSHIPLSDNGVLCECGKQGCLETETSLLIMAEKAVKDIRHGKPRHLPLKDIKYMSDVIIDAANKGDQYCIELLSHVGYMLGKGMAILIHIMNPKLIVLSGRGARAQKILQAPIQQALTQYCIPRLVENTEIMISGLGPQAGLIGAAALVMEHSPLFEKMRLLSKAS